MAGIKERLKKTKTDVKDERNVPRETGRLLKNRGALAFDFSSFIGNKRKLSFCVSSSLHKCLLAAQSPTE